MGSVTRAKPFELCIVVDDDPDILLSARLLLRDLFAEIGAFQSPEEAVAAMESKRPESRKSAISPTAARPKCSARRPMADTGTVGECPLSNTRVRTHYRRRS